MMKMIYPMRYILAILIVALTITGCREVDYNDYTKSWSYSDVVSLDPPEADQSSADILAIYWRNISLEQDPNIIGRLFPYLQEDQRSQIRLDFLDLPIQGEVDTYILLDHKAGGTFELPLDTTAEIEWDTLISISASGVIHALDTKGNPRRDIEIQLYREPVLDTITIDLNADVLNHGAAGSLQGQVFTTGAGSKTILDHSDPFSNANPPPGQAQDLFTFWDVFPAYTPAQTLRRWDGAHTGPLGGRHGLYNLLRTARNQKVPLVLLDLKAPTSLSALDYGEGLELVRKMIAEGTILIPDWLPPSPLPDKLQAKLVETTRGPGTAFGLPASHAIYTPTSDNLPAGYPVIFTQAAANQSSNKDEFENIRPLPRKGNTVIALPVNIPSDQATLDGPSISLRRALIENAITNTKAIKHTEILVLGGDLPGSTWGEPQRARATYEYLRAHPWISTLDENALATLQPGSGVTPPQGIIPADAREYKIIHDLMNAPEGQLSQAALQAYLALKSPFPSSSAELEALRENYLGGVSMLLAAAVWESEPYRGTDCSRDLDLDGEAECILASETVFAILEPDDGSLVYAFARTDTGTHQFLGPSHQFVVGLSDASTWDLSAGLKADPAVIAGAFADSNGPYQVIPGEEQLVFQSESGSKEYHLTPEGIAFEYQNGTPTTWAIPLALDPWMRFGQGWAEGYHVDASEEGLRISAGDGYQVEIATYSELLSHNFTATRDRMGRQENPNDEHPPGHYLPFPLVLLELDSSYNGYIEFKIQP